jgi:putative FmdB family regulatory protein
MPTYEFTCPNGHDFEKFFRTISSGESELPCPVCGAIAVRKISAGAGLMFKGSGFYITDYGKDGKKDQNASRKPASNGDSGSGSSGSSGDAGSGGDASSSGDSKASGESKASESKSSEGKSSEATSSKSESSARTADSKPAAQKPAESKPSAPKSSSSSE